MMSVLEKYTNALFKNEGDPIDQQKKLVSSIQKWVGIYNVFGDKDRSLSVLSLFAIILFFVPFIYVGPFSQLIYLVLIFPDKLESFKALNCLSATSVPLSKYIFMWMARSRLRTIFEMSRDGLDSISPGSSAQTVMLATLTKGRYASWLVIFNQGATHVIYLLIPFLITIFGSNRYLPTTPGECYGLSRKYETPFYEITFVLTSLGTIFSVVNQTGYIVLFVTILAHELGHFYCITETLNEIYEILSRSTNNNENIQQQLIDKKLKFCIKHHQFLLKFHDKIRELYKVIFGAHFCMMTVCLVTTLQTLNAWDVRNTILTGVTGIFPLLFYCFGGELLISAGDELSTAIYFCGWEFMAVKHARIVLLMLCISQRPLSLTAADIFVMNRQTFGNVVQVVYKIYAVFN